MSERPRVDIVGPDDDNGILYSVYDSVASAQAIFPNGPATLPGQQLVPIPAPADLGAPVLCYNSTVPVTSGSLRRSRTYSQTFCGVLVDNVIIVGASYLLGDGGHGNLDNAVAVLRTGIAHLRLLQAR